MINNFKNPQTQPLPMKQSFMQRVLPFLGILVMHATVAFSAVTIDADPVDTIVTDGTTLTLQVTASSSAMPPNPLLYEWYKQSGPDFLPVAAKSSSNKYVVTNVTHAAAGVYRVVVYETTTSNSEVSAEANVTVITRPKITVQPTAPAVMPRDTDNVNFTVTMDATGTPDFTYTFQRKVGANYVNVGASVTKPDTTHTFTLNNITLADAGTYRIRISNPSTVVAISKDVVLKLNSRPLITVTHAAALNMAFGASGTLKVVTAGNSPLTYEWLKNNVPIPKSNKSSLTIKGNDNLADGVAEGPGQYRVRITNIYTPVDSVGDPPQSLPQYTESVAATVRVIRKPKIATQPEKKKDISIVGGAAAHSFSVIMDATGNDVGTFTFQWFKDNKPYAGPGALTNTINFASVNWQDRGSYKVVIKNEVGSVTSTPGVLNVISPPLILSQTIGPVFGATKGSAKILVVGGGTAPLKYEWFFKPVDPDPMDADVPDYGAIPVGKASTLSISGLKSTNSGEYKCVITSTAKPSNGSVESVPVFLQVDDAPKIVTQTKVDGVDTTSTNIPVIPASKLHLLVAVTGTHRPSDTLAAPANPLTYQWQKDNVNLAGQTAAELLIDPAQAADTGKYRCIISNKCGTVTSNALSIVVSGPPVITGEPTAAISGIVEEKLETPQGVTATGKPPLAYQWQIRSGTAGSYTWANVTGKTAQKLSFSAATIDNDGFYRCKVTDKFGTSYSQEVQVSVLPTPAPTIGPVAGQSTVEFYPRVARAAEKVRLFGTNLKYTSKVEFGTEEASFVIESDNAILLTVPANASTSDHSIKVTTHGKKDASPGGGNASTVLQFSRTTNYGNDWVSGIARNATILPGTGYSAKTGDNRFTQAADSYGFVFYFLRIPKRSLVSVVCTGRLSGATSMDPGLLLFLENGGTFKGPDGVTGFQGFTVGGAGGVIYPGNPDQSSNWIGEVTESASVTTEVADQHLLISVLASVPPGFGLTGFGPFDLTVNITPLVPGASETTSVELSSAVNRKSSDKSVALGVWTASKAEAAEVIPDAEAGSVVRFGGSAGSKEAVLLWSPDAATTSGSEAASTVATFEMSLEKGGEGGDDQFSWQINGGDGLPLGALWVDTSSGVLRLVEPDGSVHQSIQRMTPGGGAHRFEIAVDSAASTWSVTMDGVNVTESLPLGQGAKFGEVYGAWDNGADMTASGASVSFSGFRISKD